jgi:hypothetical protein
VYTDANSLDGEVGASIHTPMEQCP